MRLKGMVAKANNKGTAFLRFPRQKCKINTHTPISATLHIKDNEVSFYTKISNYDGLGFYIPKLIASRNDLIGNELTATIQRVYEFYARIDRYSRVMIPLCTIKKHNLKHGDIVSLDVDTNNGMRTIYTKILKRKDREEYKALIRCKDITLNKVYTMKINRKLQNIKPKKSKKCVTSLDLFDSKEIGNVDSMDSIVFIGKAHPIIIPSKIDLRSIACYLGTYFADGTKVGHWRINASTPNQAVFYRKIHESICKDAILKYRITFTAETRKNIDEIKSNLLELWKEVGTDQIAMSIRIQSGVQLKRSKYGSLGISDYRSAVLVLYKRLLACFLKKVLKLRDKKLALDFICGVLEGDGSVAGGKRAHVNIHSNVNNYKILSKLLKITNLKHTVVKEKGNAIVLRIGGLEILKNLPLLKDKIFKYYPKRRKALIKKLNALGGVRFLLGKQDYASGWVKAWLKNEGFLNKKYQLSSKGKKIKNDLVSMMREVKVKKK